MSPDDVPMVSAAATAEDASSAQAPPPLRLLAQDAEDLMILSAAMQDGTVRMADIAYAPAARTLTFPILRFRHESDSNHQVEAGVQFGDVLDVKARGLPAGERDKSCTLLACEFVAADEPPGGVVMLHFAGCGDLKVTVECVDAALIDLGAPTPCEGAPRHDA